MKCSTGEFSLELSRYRGAWEEMSNLTRVDMETGWSGAVSEELPWDEILKVNGCLPYRYTLRTIIPGMWAVSSWMGVREIDLGLPCLSLGV